MKQGVKKSGAAVLLCCFISISKNILLLLSSVNELYYTYAELVKRVNSRFSVKCIHIGVGVVGGGLKQAVKGSF